MKIRIHAFVIMVFPLLLLSQTNTFPTSGNTGIGTTTPNSVLQLVSLAGQTENLARFQVHDAPGDYLEITNSTGSNGQFIPVVKGNHVSDNRYSLIIMGHTDEVNDNGGNALVNFDARRPNAPIQNRPLFVWTSYTTKFMTMLANGNLGIGTTNPGTYKLAVNGNIRAKEIKVETGWADYVFEKDYELPSLEEVENHIREKGHLQDIPSAKEVGENGINLGEMDSKLLRKIEELTLYAIQQDKKIGDMEKIIDTLLEKVTGLDNQLKNSAHEN